jgi:hypothetical protein
LTEACSWNEAPPYLVRDRDGACGEAFIRRLWAMGIRDRPISAQSPWQNGYAEQLIGSIQRESLDHVVVFGEQNLRHRTDGRNSAAVVYEHEGRSPFEGDIASSEQFAGIPGNWLRS